MKDLTGEKRANPSTGNLWEVVNSDQKLRVKCIEGPREGDTTTISRVDFLEGLLNPDDFKR